MIPLNISVNSFSFSGNVVLVWSCDCGLNHCALFTKSTKCFHNSLRVHAIYWIKMKWEGVWNIFLACVNEGPFCLKNLLHEMSTWWQYCKWPPEACSVVSVCYWRTDIHTHSWSEWCLTYEVTDALLAEEGAAVRVY